jgi:hypothetical protein
MNNFQLPKNLNDIPEDFFPELDLDPDQENSNDSDYYKNPWLWILKENWKNLSPKQEQIIKDKFKQLLNQEQLNKNFKTLLIKFIEQS